MSDDKYAREIRKTGFVLEHKVADTLRQAGWTVISNKYYEDDFQGSVREIDLLAYKISKVRQLDVYTALLISCKKSDVDIWALLARNINLKDPNADWWPLHAWSNDKAAAYEIAKSTTAKNYHDYVISHGVKEALSVPKYEVFAYQEMDRKKGVPHNDKNIFSAVTSLMKAQAYELSALPQRKKNPSSYQFNLLSIIESDLVRLVFGNGAAITQEIIGAEHYISRYIIKKRETFSRIRFITYANFEEELKDYNCLHQANCKWFDGLIDSFYAGILEDSKRRNILIEDFRNKTWWAIYESIKKEMHSAKIEKNDISLTWNNEGRFAEVEVPCDESVIQALNEDLTLHEKMARAFREVYRYKGDFNFQADIFHLPF